MFGAGHGEFQASLDYRIRLGSFGFLLLFVFLKVIIIITTITIIIIK